MKKLNNKGFTLVELLAVLVILVAIMGIAIPSISSSLERTEDKQNQARYQVLESYAELYVADNKNAIYQKLGTNSSCAILIQTLIDDGVATAEEAEDVDGNSLSGHYIIFDKTNGTYLYSKTNKGNNSCI